MKEKGYGVIGLIYLSKGIAQRKSAGENLWVSYCGQVFSLASEEKELWLKGSREIGRADAPADRNLRTVRQGKSIVEIEELEDSLGQYRLLCRCTCCPFEPSGHFLGLSKKEQAILALLRYSGFHLSVAEVVYLWEHREQLTKELFLPEHRQTLTEFIYTADTIGDNLLESQMEASPSRAEVVALFLGLLQKRRIFIL